MSYNYDELSLTDVTEILQQFRKNRERKSDEVVEIWIAVIKDNITKLKNEKTVIIEQVFMASLDCHNFEVADECLDLLKAQFPDSHRVQLYETDKYFAERKFDKLRPNVIDETSTDVATRKRFVSLVKQSDTYRETIPRLVDYLKIYMADVEAWQELCEQYLHAHDYQKAVFCAEELLLHQPHSHLFMQKTADIRYTMGGIENLELAKSYYCQAIKFNPNNLRALWGLFLATSNLIVLYKSGGNAGKRKDVWKLNQWAQKQVAAFYREHDVSGPIVTKTVPVLEHMLLTMTIND